MKYIKKNHQALERILNVDTVNTYMELHEYENNKEGQIPNFNLLEDALSPELKNRLLDAIKVSSVVEEPKVEDDFRITYHSDGRKTIKILNHDKVIIEL